MSDIEKMFYQVRVRESDRDFLRFYWWPNGDLDSKVKTYRMTVHIFGAASSPSVSNFALLQTAIDYATDFSESAIQAVNTQFYVDDLLCSVATAEDVIKLVEETTHLCALGGFRLTKWVSNSREVLDTIPETDRATTVSLNLEHLPAEHALGVFWDVETDCLGFQTSVKTAPPTRRQVLSLVSSVFDPLGVAAPFILRAKVILQKACLQGMGWDEELPETELRQWTNWLQDLPNLEKISIPRCLKPKNLGKVVHLQVHHFADASETGYGIVSYLRLQDENNQICCSFLLARSRVVPLKKITMPRMELTAAVLAVRLSLKLKEEIKIEAQHLFWTDSLTVIRYIANESTRFQTFVANRIAVIRDCTNLDQWRYVSSQQNPADLASRGSDVGKLQNKTEWRSGPEFLWFPESQWPEQPEYTALSKDDENVKAMHVGASTTVQATFVDRVVSRSSSWIKMKKMMAWILVMVSTLKKWAAQRKALTDQLQKTETDSAKIEQQVQIQMNQIKTKTGSSMQALPVDFLNKAEEYIIQNEQRSYYPDEFARLNNATSEVDAHAPKSQRNQNYQLQRLDPFLENGIIRVGGRLRLSNLPYEAKHQYVIPPKSQIASLIILDIHRRMGHMGKNAITAELRKRYWIPRVGSLIKYLMSQCVMCKKYRLKTCQQKMSDLPVERVMPDQPPFTHTGVDFFGPFGVKRGRTIVKRYGVLFTCMASRAIHLEIAHSMTTDSCINAIRRFIARRGQVRSIRSDRGTNLVGAEHELRESIEQWNQAQISNSLMQQGITWQFNPASASHFGGVWERLIRMVRKVLYSLMNSQVINLDDEGLQTLFCEVESIVNNRPITRVSDNPNDLEVLTPSHLLLLDPSQSLPCGVFEKSDNYARRRWRQIQYIADVFWHRWRNEYLHLLQERQKWFKPHRNIQVGDVVLIVDNPRSAWSLGQIQNVKTDKRGLVRAVQVRTTSSLLERPIHKLCLLLEGDRA